MFDIQRPRGAYGAFTGVTFPQEVIGIFGQDEGVNIGTGTILNVTGENVSLSISGTVLNLNHTNPTVIFPQEVIGVFGKDKGQSIGTGTILNVVGDNVSLSLSGTTLTLEHTNPAIAFPQELIGVMGWDDGVPKGTGTVIDFGNNLSASLSGTVLRVDATPPNVTFPQDNIGVAIQSEGNFIATGVTIDVMGAVTLSGTVINLRVPKTISFVTPGIVAGGLVFTNLVAADSTYLGVVTDLTGYTQCKIGGVFGAVNNATASGTIIHIMWATGSSYASLQELSLNPTTEQGRLRWITSTQRATDW